MNEELRQFLYPLGWISGLAFTSRFLIQWIDSEKAHKSIVTPLFWRISLFGNLALLIHAFIQLQFHVCVVQVSNAVISWRNLDLMQQEGNRWKLKSVIFLLIASLVAMTAAFSLQSSQVIWFRSPINEIVSIPSFWHLIGAVGLLLFNSRFWVQWWQAEREGRSYLGPAFWWISLIGALLCCVYFFKISDPVNLLGPLFGIVPTIRNLMIIRQESKINEKLQL